MATRALCRSKASILTYLCREIHRTSVNEQVFGLKPALEMGFGFGSRAFHDGRPRGTLWRGKKLIGKEAILAIHGMKRHKKNQDKLDFFVNNQVQRLLKTDMVAVLAELERQGEVHLSITMYNVIREQHWYKPDVYMYKDLIVSLARSKKMDDVMKIWKQLKEDKLFPDAVTYTAIIGGFLRAGSPSDAMNIYEDMKASPNPPDVLPFSVMLKGLLPFPLLRNKVKKEFEELFPEKHMYDPPEEIFGVI